jgi:hypothetical protein
MRRWWTRAPGPPATEWGNGPPRETPRRTALALPTTDVRLRVGVVTMSGRPAEVEFRVHSGAVEVWHWNQRCAVFDRWKLGRWLAGPGTPLVCDRAALSVDRMVDRNGRIALSLPDVMAWTLAPKQLTDLKNLV